MLATTAIAVSLIPQVSAGNLRSAPQVVLNDEASRKLIVDSDRSKYCFRDGRNKGLSNPHNADFYENPFFANNVCIYLFVCNHENNNSVLHLEPRRLGQMHARRSFWSAVCSRRTTHAQ